MKRTQLNLVLAVAAVGLGAFVIHSTRKDHPREQPLTALKTDAIEHIVIAHPGKPEIHLDKLGGRWEITAPVKLDTDPLNVNGVLSLATTPVKRQLDAAEVKKSELGLDPPRFTVKFNDTLVQFGDVEPLQYQRYLEVGNRIVLVSDPPTTTFDSDYSDLASKHLLPADAQIEKIEVPGFTVARNADGKGWQATPADGNENFGDLQQFVDAWKGERAMWCQLDSAAPAADEKADDRITITLKDRTLQFRIVSRDPQFVLAAPDLKLRYTLSKADADKLLKLPTPAKPAPAVAKPGPDKTAADKAPAAAEGSPAGKAAAK
jgi:hypothetical protein